MRMIAGIDEAGLGPVLGPLVETAVVMEVPEELADADLWQVLSETVSRKAERRGDRVAIADSKKLYGGLRDRAGLGRLERGVLGALWVLGFRPCSLHELVRDVAPSCGAALARYPWYCDMTVDLPAAIDEAALTGAGLALAQGLDRAGVRLSAVRCEVVNPGELNELIEQTDNKAAAHLLVTRRLLHWLAEIQNGAVLAIHIDRHGARRRYRAPLQEMFPDSMVWVRQENPSKSCYTVEMGAVRFDVTFAVGCEQRQLPVALASMVCKYVREIHMQLFNRYWTQRVAGLAPTAGYAVDGRRFFESIQFEMNALGIDRSLVWRER